MVKDKQTSKKGEVRKSQELEVVDSTPVASGQQLTEVKTGRVGVPGAPAGEEETTSIQKDGPISDQQKKNQKGEVTVITGKYTRRQPMTSMRKIESFDTSKGDKISYDQIVSRLEEGQRYAIKNETGRQQDLKVINTPWGKVITTEDHSDITSMTGPNFSEYVQDPSEEELKELDKAKKSRKKDIKKDFGEEETNPPPEEETTSVSEGNTLEEREVKDLKPELEETKEEKSEKAESDELRRR